MGMKHSRCSRADLVAWVHEMSTNTIEGLEAHPINCVSRRKIFESPKAVSPFSIVTPMFRPIALGDIADVYVEERHAGAKK